MLHGDTRLHVVRGAWDTHSGHNSEAHFRAQRSQHLLGVEEGAGGGGAVEVLKRERDWMEPQIKAEKRERGQRACQ